jgi:hypothetical protein
MTEQCGILNLTSKKLNPEVISRHARKYDLIAICYFLTVQLVTEGAAILFDQDFMIK